MHLTHLKARTWLFGTVALGALAVSASGALAGGFEVREQSAFFQGTSFAGTAAGGSSLSSVFWNPATSYIVGNGITTDSSYSLILPEMNVEADFVAPTLGGTDTKVDFGRDALVPASYAAYRLNSKTVLAIGMNSAYGLTTKPDNIRWAGQALARTSEIFSVNLNPSVSYEVMPGVSVGVGLQAQYFEIRGLKSALYDADGDDIGFGATAGINITPFRGTSIGLGYRSRIEHDVDGRFNPTATGQLVGLVNADLATSLDTPDKVTLSLRQELSASARLMGTVEWTNWSVFGAVPVDISPNPPAALNANWDDGWLYALGGEYDVSSKLTLRAGLAYEESPIQDSESRLIQLPDNNRVWASIGATYNWSDSTKINVAYSHVWVEDGDIERESLIGPGGGVFIGEAEDNGADIISVGVTMKLGDPFHRSEPAPLK